MASSSPADPSPPPDPDDNPGAILAGALLHHRRDESRIRRIIAKNGAASFKSYNSHGKTALHRAAELSSRHLPILIAAAQPHIDQGDREGRTAVHYAAAAANAATTDEAAPTAAAAADATAAADDAAGAEATAAAAFAKLPRVSAFLLSYESQAAVATPHGGGELYPIDGRSARPTLQTYQAQLHSLQ